MRIIVISLKRSTERRRHMSAELEAAGLPFEFLDAVDGSAGEYERFGRYDEKRCLRYFGKALLPGEIGCYASHYLAWQRSAELGEPVLVMEDDMKLMPAFPTVLGKVPGLLQRFPLVRLYGLENKRPFRDVADLGDGYRLIRFTRGPAGTQCYAITPLAARVLLAGAEVWREPVDRYLDHFWSHRLASMAIRPYALRHVGYRAMASNVRSWDRQTTAHTFPAKLGRMADHLGRHVYNLLDLAGAAPHPRAE